MKTPFHPVDSNSPIASGAINAPKSVPPTDQTSVDQWMPRRWSDELLRCVFLPRLLEKGRRTLESERQHQDLMNGYLFGDFDYADGMLLRFLRTKEVRVRELLRDLEDDEAVATALFRESRRSAEEIKAWSKYFRRINAPFVAMWDADEGRREPGFGTSLLKGFYNHVMMPPVYLCFRIASGLRRRRKGAK